MVETEFSLVRFGGDAAAAAVYEGVTPLTAEDVGECIRRIAARPPHVNVDQLVVLARDQAGARQIHRRAGLVESRIPSPQRGRRRGFPR